MDKINVLLIGNNTNDALNLKSVLSSNFKLMVSEDLSDTIDDITYNDLILLNLNYPTSDFKKTFNNILSLKTYPPVVIWSEYENEEYGAELISKGAEDYIFKSDLSISRKLLFTVARNKRSLRGFTSYLLHSVKKIKKDFELINNYLE